jgi:hypothetical protein
MARSAFLRRRSIAAAHGAILTVGVARGNEENSGAYAHGVGRRLRSPDGPRATRPRMMAIAATCASAFDGCDENFSRDPQIGCRGSKGPSNTLQSGCIEIAIEAGPSARQRPVVP